MTRQGLKVLLDTDDEQEATQWITEFLTQVRQEWPKKPLGVILDIDNTVIMTPSRRRALGVTSPKLALGTAVYAEALRLGFQVYFVTARGHTEQVRQFTESELQHYGFGQHEGLFLMPDVTRPTVESIGIYKTAIRTMLHQHAAPIVLTVGDQWTDLLDLPPLGRPPRLADQDYRLLSHQKTSHRYLAVKEPGLAAVGVKVPDRPM